MKLLIKLAPVGARLSLAAVAPLVGFSCRFVRTILLSHFLAPAELGVAIALTVVIATFELISEVGLNHVVLVRSGPEGRDFLAAAHSLQIVRGLLISAVVASLSFPLSQLFGIPQLWKSFLVAAAVPLVRSWYHFGIHQVQRDYEYKPYALSVGISSLVSLGTAMLLVTRIPDHRIILLSIGCENIVLVLLSHLLSPIKYECRAPRQTLREVLSYGLPLTANGIALALISQTDRIVAGTLGVETLAVYAVIVGLAQTPISPIFEIFGTLGMSIMVRSQDSRERQVASFSWVVWLFSIIAFAYAASMGMLLDILAPLIYGPHYLVPASWRVFITLSVFLWTCRGPHTVLLLTQRKTGSLAFANATVGLGVAAALLIIRVFPTPEAILAGKLFGDAISMAVFHWASFRALRSSRATIIHSVIFSLCSVFFLGIIISSSTHPTWSTRILLSATCLLPLSLLLWRAYTSWKRRELVFSAEKFASS